jgi:ATP-binding cassette, subfamily B, bacterial
LSPLGNLLDAYSQLQYLGGHLARLDDVMSTEVEEKGTLDPKSIRGDLSLHQVHFSFPGSDQMVVQEIDLEIHAGEKIGIVGPSGAGKSTLARLLLGMYQPTGGTIHLDGVDLRELDMARLRNRMGVVLQDTFLFNDTVRANLSLNEPDLDLSQIREAARIACIDEFIESLPQGYDSMIGENGASLSGGQRQRLSLARAIVSRPALLLLDEATSSLDPETEASVHRNLAELGCTRILIAHRLKTVMDADRILVLDQGRIVQSGTFESLRHQPGLFQELFTSSGGGHA